MSDVTHILSAIEQGGPSGAAQLLPLVYDESPKLAADKMAQEKPGQTLQVAALVHEAYLRLVDVKKAEQWDSQGHFFAAAAEAMRRILIEAARRKQSTKRAGDLWRVEFKTDDLAIQSRSERLLALDESLARLEQLDPKKARSVPLSSRHPTIAHVIRMPHMAVCQILGCLRVHGAAALHQRHLPKTMARPARLRQFAQSHDIALPDRPLKAPTTGTSDKEERRN